MATDVACAIADELAACDVKLVASLPDNWLMGLISSIDADGKAATDRLSLLGVRRAAPFAQAG
jgi:hypothetical protein